MSLYILAHRCHWVGVVSFASNEHMMVMFAALSVPHSYKVYGVRFNECTCAMQYLLYFAMQSYGVCVCQHRTCIHLRFETQRKDATNICCTSQLV